jgi:hypothetical protein
MEELMKLLVTYLLCAALAAGNFFPARTLHDCAMSGRQNMTRCCCEPPPAAAAEPACGACGNCGDNSRAAEGLQAAGSEGTIPSAPETSWVAPSTSRCCSITYEKSLPAGLRPAAGAETETKHAVAPLPMPLATLVEAAALPSPGHGWRNRNGPGRGAPFPATPLFLLHRSLLI